MVHGDDQGLILPPRLAPYQVVIVPIFKNDEEKALVFETAHKIRKELVKAGVRVKVDEREGQSPGFKFNDWELRGVPLRLEVGPKDVQNQQAVLVRRDSRPRVKEMIAQDQVAGERSSYWWRFSRICISGRWTSGKVELIAPKILPRWRG